MSKFFALFFIAIIVLLQTDRLQRSQGLAPTDENIQGSEELAATKIRNIKGIPTLGYRNIFADWVYLLFLQYFGDDEIRRQTGYSLSPDFFESIIANDPYYVYFYVFLSGGSSLYAGQPARAVTLMNEGLSHMSPEGPNNGYLVWRYKGTDELLFLGDSAAAQQSFQTAADWANQSDQPEAQAVAAISQRTADFLAQNPISKRAQVDAWASILTNSFDASTQQLAIDRIEALGGRVNINDDGRIQIGYPQQD